MYYRPVLHESDIKSWFKNVQSFLAGLDNAGDTNYLDILNDQERCYNTDESFFLLNPSFGNVVAQRATKNIYEVRGYDKEGITVIACFSVSGVIVKPQIIYPYERVPNLVRGSLPPSLHMSYSKSGWMNAKLFYEFIKDVFHPHIVKKQGINVPTILYNDRHSSHLSLNVCELCEQHNIILVKIYSNSTLNH